jgi:hypothetical protein
MVVARMPCFRRRALETVGATVAVCLQLQYPCIGGKLAYLLALPQWQYAISNQASLWEL